MRIMMMGMIMKMIGIMMKKDGDDNDDGYKSHDDDD